MKVKAFQIPLLLLVLDFSLSIPAVAAVVNIRVGSVSFLGTYRFFSLILLILSFLLILRKNKFFVQKKQLLIPIFILSLLSIFQSIALTPRSLAIAHVRGLVRIFFWFFSYLGILSTLTPINEQKIRRFLIAFITILFAITVLQYPLLVIQSQAGIGSILSGLFQGSKIKLYGIFHAANEEANLLMTVFPFVLYWVENKKVIKRGILRFALINFTWFVLLLNGTRTAAFCTLPLILFVYYSNLSPKRILLALGLLIMAVTAYLTFSADIITSIFSDELKDGGSFGYRLEHAWIPAITYTLNNSPLFGFGSRGWEYLNEEIKLFNVVNEWGNIQGSAAPHNVYVWILVTWGMIGLTAHVSFLFILFRQSFLLFKTKKLYSSADREIGKALFCSLCGYSLWGFISNAHAPIGWITFFILASITASLETKSVM